MYRIILFSRNSSKYVYPILFIDSDINTDIKDNKTNVMWEAHSIYNNECEN